MISVAESAELLGVSSARVRKLISDGILPASKVGRVWLLEEKDVMQRASTNPKAGRPKEKSFNSGNSLSAGVDIESKRDLYFACKEAFKFHPHPQLISNSQTPEEAAFYMAVADFFLQQKQRELIKAGVY